MAYGAWLPVAQHGGGGAAALPLEERSIGACEPAYQYFLDQLLLPETPFVRLQIVGAPRTRKGVSW